VPSSHQTLRLDRGAHRTPGGGACAVELASLLAGEPFGDRPASVSPVLAAFVRGYNDALDDARRQDLLPVAAALVGTVGDTAIDDERRALCDAWSRALWGGSRMRRLLRPRYADHDHVVEAAGRDTARRVRAGDDALHAKALTFVAALAAAGRSDNRPTSERFSCSWVQGICLSDPTERGVVT
jgi:hypothetical protein